MNPVVKVLKSIYDFFAGDAIILVSVPVAFVVGALVLHAFRAPTVVAAVLFVGIVVAGLSWTVGREVSGRK